MLLFAVLVLVPACETLMLTVRCMITMTAECLARPAPFKEWLSDTLPVIVAIIMRGSRGDET